MPHHKVLTCLLPAFLLSLHADESLEQLRARSIKVFWTDTPPVLDGKMTDACWGNSEVATDFRTFQKPSERASQQTEVRLCYNADNLYLFYKLYDKRMDKLFYGPPEDMRDMLNFSGDVAELFLDPGRTRKRKYQFCASPLGTRYDGGPGIGARYNPEWNVRPGIYKDYWTLEMAIPFAELALNGDYYGTPQKGDAWGIQFCRDRASLHEWSQWVPTPRSFHEVNLFGTAVFMGRKKGPSLPVVNVEDFQPLFFGKSTLQLRINPSLRKASAEFELTRNRRRIARQRLKPSGKLDIPYHIIRG